MKNNEKHPNKKFMRMAIAEAKKGLKNGQYPIGAVVILNNKVIGAAYTTLNKTRDPSCHAEINAIRMATKKELKNNPNTNWSSVLKGAWLYSTFESCAMCTSLAIWANMRGIVYGNTMQDFIRINKMHKGKDHYIYINSEEIVEKSTPELILHKEFLVDETSLLLDMK